MLQAEGALVGSGAGGRIASGSFPMLMALLTGVAQAASLAWPWDVSNVVGGAVLARGAPLWWLQLLCMATLVGLLLRAASVLRAAALGGLFALGWLSAGFGWLYTSMHSYGDLSAPLAALAVVTLGAALALYYATACMLFRLLAPVNQAFAALAFAALWTLAELARGQWLTGFGWGAIGYAHLDGPLQAGFAWLGVYGVGAVAAALAAGLALLIQVGTLRSKWPSAVLVVALVMLASAMPVASGVAQGHLRVTLLQGNIAQEEKFQPATGVLQALRWYGEQLRGAQGDLVITPETAFPVLPEQLPEGYW